jgi:hypothetical protein
MLKTKVVQEYSFLSKDVQPPFSFNTTEVCYHGTQIGIVTDIKRLSNKKGSIYTVAFKEQVEIKNHRIYYNGVYFAEVKNETRSISENVPILFALQNEASPQHKAVLPDTPSIDARKQEDDNVSQKQILFNRIHNKMKTLSFSELLDLYDKIKEMK